MIDFSFLDCLSPFCKMNLKVIFPYLVKYYHIIFIIIVFRLGNDRPSKLDFFHARFTFLNTVSVCFFILFRSCCSNVEAFEHSCTSAIFLIAIPNCDSFFARRNTPCFDQQLRLSEFNQTDQLSNAFTAPAVELL